MSDERINSITASDYSIIPPFLDHYGTKTRVGLSESCLKQDEITCTHGKKVNIYIVHEITKSIVNISYYPTLENCLFVAVSLTKMLISIGTNILDMELDLIEMGVFHFLALD